MLGKNLQTIDSRMPAFRPSFLAWARTLPDGEVYRLDPNGPKPRKIGGVIWNSKARLPAHVAASDTPH